jgi:photosystem II stability/assembly factor-like uncharacterized protein
LHREWPSRQAEFWFFASLNAIGVPTVTICLSPNGLNRYTLDAAPTRLLVATAEGAVTLARAAESDAWHHIDTTLTGRHVSSLTTVPGHPRTIFAGTHNDGIHVSDDGGAHWQSCSDGLTARNVFSLAAAPQRDGLAIYAGTEPAALFRSRDLGQSWHAMPALAQMAGHEKWNFPAPPHIAHTKSLTVDPHDPDTLYAAIEQGAFLKSTDGGESWHEFDDYYRATDRTYRDIHQIIPVPSKPRELFMTTGLGLFHSDDSGVHWERLTDESFRIAYPDHLVVSPDDDKLLIMSGAAIAPTWWAERGAANGAIRRSRDGGRTWEAPRQGAPETMRGNFEAMMLASHPGGFSVFAGTTAGEVYASDDGGENWTVIAEGLPALSKSRHYRLAHGLPMTHAPAAVP